MGIILAMPAKSGEPVGANAWAVRAHVKPFVDWIWGGIVLMAAGGFVAIADRRYRRRLAASRLELSSRQPAA